MPTISKQTVSLRHTHVEEADVLLDVSWLTSSLTATVAPSAELTATRAYDLDHPPFAPTSFWNAPLPATPATSDAETPAAANALQAQAATATTNFGPWSNGVYVLPDDYPLTPVWYVGYQNNHDGVQPVQRPLQQLMLEGLPIPPEHADRVAAWKAANDSDLSFVAYQPGLDRLWECWRLQPCDPLTHGGCSWLAYEGGRMSFVSQSTAGWKDRYNGATYSTLPTQLGLRATYEHRDWGVTAAKLPLLGAIITNEDLDRGEIDHAIGLACQPQYIAKGFRWPAQAYDGYVVSGPVQEGMRFWLPREVDLSGLHPFAQMIGRCLQTYGCVLLDRSGSLSFRAEPGVERAWAGTPRPSVLAGFPWSQLKVLA